MNFVLPKWLDIDSKKVERMDMQLMGASSPTLIFPKFLTDTSTVHLWEIF